MSVHFAVKMSNEKGYTGVVFRRLKRVCASLKIFKRPLKRGLNRSRCRSQTSTKSGLKPIDGDHNRGREGSVSLRV